MICERRLKLLRKRICTVFLVFVLVLLPVKGARAAADVIEPDMNGVYHVRVTSGIVSGRQYILKVVSGSEASYTVTDGTTIYVDQAAAGEDGIGFSFIPMQKNAAVVLLYGEFTDGITSPVVIGVIRSTVSFTDIGGSWAEDSISYMTGNGYMNGTSSTAFSPDAPMSRAMLAAVLYRIDGQPQVTGIIGFRDVQAGVWYSDAVLWASRNQIISGYDSEQFGMDDNVTREQIAAALYRYAQHKGYDISRKSNLDGFIDAFRISDWAEDAVAWANASGIITGKTSTTLEPLEQATRAEVAAMLVRFIKNAG